MGKGTKERWGGEKKMEGGIWGREREGYEGEREGKLEKRARGGGK